MLAQFWSVLVKDLQQWSRERQATAGPLLLPIVLMLITAVLMGYGGDEWNIGLVVEGQGPEARRLARVIEQVESNITPYFRVITRDSDEASRLAARGRLHLVVHIPADFDAQLAAGQPPVVHTRLFNINTDVTKNARLRLDHAILAYLADSGQAPVTVRQHTTQPEDVWRRAFIAGGAVVVALLVGAALNTAIMVAREWEGNTVKEIRLAPASLAAIAAGKLAAGLVATAAGTAVTVVVAVLLFGLRIPADRLPALVGVGVPAALAASGVGLGLGAMFRDYRTVQPLVLVICAGSFFASGGFSSVATLPPLVRRLNAYWPPSYVFEAMQWTMHAGEGFHLSGLWPGLTLAVLLGLAFGVWQLRRAM